ncbi:DUF5801 repeats-in-toxin domain-containing protein [Mesorhizobium sp. M7A.F.Ca.US.010.02.1.1]|uniref:DUF5801 repeats-in-toxin domain-containing protein n=1 Tax=unclassified Mesorhizobium TaxID=325217 RepID=UPI000FD23C9C|nr:DUF5801 repeats-in-toxin domain-containing protein [Mesorhizobium sp. M7A.F.Ca.US.010.02.1.1]RUW87516.1 hypothetical protein EOA19_33600 [Mesorhizobium sp. M7A.F.Ca.US.010.02.1.1]
MALDIVAQDIIIDETIGFTDDDINPAIPPYDTNTTVQYLLGLDDAGGLASPQVAFQANFVEASATSGETITSVVLTQNDSGTPFSTTVGVYSGIQTVDGKYVWLFQDQTHPNVVIGVIGTSASIAPAANGPLAFSFGLVSTSNTNADLYLVQYVALMNPDPDKADVDLIDLSGKVYASVTGTSVLNFSQLGDAPPGHNKWYILDADVASTQKILVTAHDNGVQAEVNVSTQGLGVSSQDVRFGRDLQIDLINGGTQSAGKNFTNTPTAPDYGTHIETVSSAGFSISQSTPTNTKADIEIHAYNEAGNEEGAAFPGDALGTEINITGVTFKLNGVTMTAAQLGITVDLTGTGAILQDVGEGVTVDFTTAGGVGGTFDRFTIKNIDTEKDYFDVKEVHFAGNVANAYNEEVGSFINFDDDGPSISTTGIVPDLTVDESNFAGNDSHSFAGNFAPVPGADGDDVAYALSIGNVDSGLVDTLTSTPVTLSVVGGVVIGENGNGDEVFRVSVDAATGVVTLDQSRSVVHSDHTSADESVSLAAGIIVLMATITDGDGDTAAAPLEIGDHLIFKDDGPSITADGTEPTITVDESSLGDNSASFSAAFTSNAGADGDAISYVLDINQVTNDSGLTDTLTGEAVLLSVNGAGAVEGRTAGTGDLVFTVSVSAAGLVTLDQARSVIHSPDSGPDQATTLASDDLVTLTATITDGDGDQDDDTVNIGTSLIFKDDAPTITVPFDGDASGGGSDGTHETLANAAGATASGAFGYDIGADARPDLYYDATHSDFVDSNGDPLDGVQIALTGTITGGGGGNLITSNVTLASEDSHLATFNFTFTYDKDPADDVQTGTADGTLLFNKDDGTYTITLADPLEGFSFDVLHTNELLAKAPIGNTGHPLIVAEQLTPDGDPNPFFVQFTANSTTNSIKFGFNSTGDGAAIGDTTFNNAGATHDMITNVHEDWVSATQATNGVAGDTIQKGEALTLRFFDENILGDVNPKAPNGGTEQLDPTASASGVVIKFDGIGNSEDLVLILDLKDANGNEITRAVNVENSDLIKGNANVPFPYNTEFTLDNNDALLILESNDYNDGTETFQIQGVQIMQSANGLTGDAINLNGAIGAGGDSNATSGLSAWDTTDNDVLKIVDIGFVQQTSGTVDASLDFAFNVADADGDLTPILPEQSHILVDVA